MDHPLTDQWTATVRRYRRNMSDAETDAGADSDDEGRAPICPACGVTALPAETANVLDATFVCENPDCDAYGEPV